MTAIPATEGAEAAQAGPPPPFDAELRPALDAMTAAGRPAFTLENIPLIRQAPPLVPVPTDEDLRRGGAFEVSTGTRPGPGGRPRRPAADLPPGRRRRAPSAASTSSTAAG